MKYETKRKMWYMVGWPCLVLALIALYFYAKWQVKQDYLDFENGLKAEMEEVGCRLNEGYSYDTLMKISVEECTKRKQELGVFNEIKYNQAMEMGCVGRGHGDCTTEDFRAFDWARVMPTSTYYNFMWIETEDSKRCAKYYLSPAGSVPVTCVKYFQ